MAKVESKNKKMIIKGAGKFMAKIPGCNEVITLGTLNNMKLDIQLEMQDIEGGDSSVPLDTLLKKKLIDITAQDAKFDLNMLRLVLGSKLKEGVTGAPYKMETEQVTLGTGAVGKLVATLLNEALHAPEPKVFLSDGTELAADQFDLTGDQLTVKESSSVKSGSRVTVHYAVAVLDSQKDDDGYVWVLEEKHTVDNGQITLAFGTQLYEERSGKPEDKFKHVSVRTLKENKLLKRTTSKTPADLEYYVDGKTGQITFSSEMQDTDVYVNYKRYEVVDILDIASRDFPITVSIVHDGVFEQKDGSLQGYQTELFTCRVKSNFSIDAQRQQASTHSVTLTVIDPERPDGKLGTIKRYELRNNSMKDIC